jgi:predicted nucleic acid-binding protein
VLSDTEGINGAERRDAALALIRRLPRCVLEASPEAMLAAADLATDHRLGLWDAVILSARLAGGLPTTLVRGP